MGVDFNLLIVSRPLISSPVDKRKATGGRQVATWQSVIYLTALD